MGVRREEILDRFDARKLLFQPLEVLIALQTNFPPLVCEAHIGAVMAEVEAVLGTAGEHPVRVPGPHRHQIVDEDTGVRLLAPQDQRFFPFSFCAALIPAMSPGRRPPRSRWAIDVTDEDQTSLLSSEVRAIGSA